MQVPELFGDEEKWMCHHKTKGQQRVAFSQLLQTPSNDLWYPSRHFLRCYLVLFELYNNQISSCLWHHAPRGYGGHLDFILTGVPSQQSCREPLTAHTEPWSPTTLWHKWMAWETLESFWNSLRGWEQRWPQQEVSWELDWCQGGGWGWVGSMDYSSVVLRDPHFITLRTHTSPEGRPCCW